ncbi:MAG: PAS domain S-box protein [bacterium]
MDKKMQEHGKSNLGNHRSSKAPETFGVTTQTLVDLSPDFTVVHTLDGRIVLVNRAFETLLGYTKEELKSPFNAINGFLEILFKDYDQYAEEDRKAMIRRLYFASKNVSQLLMNLLD